MFCAVTGKMTGNGKKMIKKVQKAIARMLTVKPSLPMLQGPNSIGRSRLNRRIENISIGIP